MRFKKGSRIEVFNEKIAPSGAWRCADIISGNGHTYSVKFVSSTSMMNGASAERVSRKNIRPCPPPVISAHTLTGGEMVEVFDDFSWKIATVMKRVGFGDFYLVRLLGSSREFQVPEDHVRVRQSWEDDNWFVIRKGSEFPRSGKISTSKWYHYSGADGKIDVRPGDNCLAVQNNTVYHESNAVSARTLKRVATFSASSAESCIGNSSKIRAVSEERLRQQTNPMLPNSMKKGQCWRHACLASKGLVMILGFKTMLLA